jgi:Sulfotransferase domain
MVPEKVFGIGLGKTGTTTLGRALEILGYDRHVTCDFKLTRAWKEKGLGPIWEVSEHNNNFEDYPWPLIYQDLYEKYPEAKYILTLRPNVDKWYKSLCDHAMRTGPSEFKKIVYGSYMPHDFEEELKIFYLDHQRNVESFFKENAAEKLLILCWENGDAWEKLCTFLEKPIPRTSFPHLNQEPEKRRKGEPFLKRISKKVLYKGIELIDRL